MNEKKRLDMNPGDLSERQSTRTTFRFSKEALEALGWLSERYGVPMKEVLHSTLDVLQPAIEQWFDHKPGEQTKLEINKVDENTIRRTMVVTKKTLIYLNKLSKQYTIARDDLLNIAILFTKEVTCSNDESKIKIYRQAYKLISQYYSDGEGVERKLRELLGEDDLIVNEFELGIATLMGAYIKIKEEIKKIEKS